MTESNRQNLEERIDRYARRELTAAEGRQLAHEALDSPELFDELACTGLAATAVDTIPKVARFPTRARAITLAAALAAAAVVIVWIRPPALQKRPLKEVAASLLTSELQEESGDQQVFRGAEPAARPPRRAGSIVSIEDGTAEIDLGSLDGIAKGSELPIFRDERSTEAIGRLDMTTVFREHSRGKVLDSRKIGVGNRVRVTDAIHWVALVSQVDAVASRGDLSQAQTLANTALTWARAANLPDGMKRALLERLGGLAYRSGALQEAEKYYTAAIADWKGAVPAASPQERARQLNDLAVVRVLRGEYPGTVTALNQAAALVDKTDLLYARTSNNLGVLAETRGDGETAKALYERALHALAAVPNAPAQERKVVEANLARIRKSQ